MRNHISFSSKREGISLVETLAVVSIIGVLAVYALPRLSTTAKQSQAVECHVNVGVIEVHASLWRRSRGAFPNATLSDIAAVKEYFPEGLPTCPVDGTTYSINTSTGHVIGHDHD